MVISAKSGRLLAYAVKDLMVVCHCVLINPALLWLYSVPLCTIQGHIRYAVFHAGVLLAGLLAFDS